MCSRPQLKPIVTTQLETCFAMKGFLLVCFGQIILDWGNIFLPFFSGPDILRATFVGQLFFKGPFALLTFLPVHHVSGVCRQEAALCGESLLSLNVGNLSS